MSGGEWNTSRERKQLAADARELQREQVRLAKRMLRDLRWSAERSTLRESDWADLLKLHHDYGKEGPSQLWLELIPYWSQSQRLNGGIPCPDALQPDPFTVGLPSVGRLLFSFSAGVPFSAAHESDSE